MRVLIDTNIVVDVIECRQPFFDDSYRVMQLAANDQMIGFISAGSVSDIFYIIRKSFGDGAKARQAILDILQLVGVCDTAAADVNAALLLRMSDFEDAVLAAAAKREKAEYIVTRNVRDFAGSPVQAVSPKDFLLAGGW